MFELPEYITLARQITRTLKGKVIRSGHLGNTPHKFVWYNRSEEEFEGLTRGKRIGESQAKGKWLFVALEPGFILLFGECGGKMLYHPAGSRTPDKYHLHLAFEDDSFFTVTTRMWGSMELYEKKAAWSREHVKGMRVTPVEAGFTLEYFSTLLEDLSRAKKRSVKSLLTQDQLIPGLGNAIAQDILFQARLHPRHPIDGLSQEQKQGLYDAILNTLNKIVEMGGRYDEFDLFNEPGGYVRIMDKKAAGNPCPACGTTIEKTHYLGGACYFCPACQKQG